MWFLALGAGFYGYLFPGNINMMLMSLYQSKKYVLLAGILALALAFEYAYCFLSLNCYQYIDEHTALAKTLLYTGCALGIFFGCWIWLEQTRLIRQKSNVLITRGVLSIVIHPQQITFWLFVFALTRSIGNIPSVAAFALFDVVGCLFIFCVYIFVGARLLQAWKINDRSLQKIAGLLYISSSLYTLAQLILS